MLKDDEEESLADGMLKVMFAFSDFANMMGQGRVLYYTQRALAGMDAMVKFLMRKAHLEGDGVNGDSGPLGGLFRRCRLWELKASLMMTIGNTTEATRCLTASLASAPGGDDYTARLSRALVWAATGKKDDARLHDEFVAYLRVAHPDHRERHAACAWLSILVHRNSKLGTYQDAARYWVG